MSGAPMCEAAPSFLRSRPGSPDSLILKSVKPTPTVLLGGGLEGVYAHVAEHRAVSEAAGERAAAPASLSIC